MAGKFPKKVKYQKKNFNIYKRFNEKFVKKSQIPAEKVKKPVIDKHDPAINRPEPIKRGGLFSKFNFDDLFEDLFGKK